MDNALQMKPNATTSLAITMLVELTSSQRFFYVCTCVTSFVGVPANVIAVIYLHVGDHAIHESTLLLYKAVATTDLVVALSVSKFAVQYLSDFKISVTDPVRFQRYLLDIL